MADTRALFRRLLREAARFPQYNFRAYARRRIGEEFRRRPLTPDALHEAQQTLALLHRQTTVANLYPRT